MIVLDASVVIVALPSAQRALHISIANRQWVMSAYTLAFGSLLLLGGRIADYLGRRRMFIIGLLGFGAASALGGLAQNPAMLFGARALQGAFAAVMAPAALSLLTVTFTEPRERARAFGVYGAIAGGGAAIGLVLGGTLTQLASWRWTLLINVPIAAGRRRGGQPGRSARAGASRKAGYDLPGRGDGHRRRCSSSSTASPWPAPHGWAAPLTVALLVGAAVLLAAFVAIELRVDAPAAPAAGRPRPQPGRLVPGLAAGRERPCWAPSCSSPTSSRERCTTRRSRPGSPSCPSRAGSSSAPAWPAGSCPGSGPGP